MKAHETTGALTVILFFCVSSVFAQDQKKDVQQADPSGPIQPLNSDLSGGYGKAPAGAARGVSAPYDSQTYDPSQVTSDQNTLAGAEYFGLGSLHHAHNIFDPAISYSQLGEIFSQGSGQSTLSGQTLIGGSLNFDRTWDRYNLAIIYNGGETINFGPNAGHFPFHNLNFIQQANWARWHFILRDDFSASPGAAFTGSGVGGPGLLAQLSSALGTSINSLGQAFLPSQTIETGYVNRYMNSILGQAEYSISRRSTLTFAGSFGLLNFSGVGFISSHMLNVQAGYDYQLDPKNSIAFLGSYGWITYTGVADSTTNYTGSIAYGRKITGRMAFQLAVGPEQIRSMGSTGNSQLWLVSVNSSLSYAWRRSNGSFSFARSLTSGSGVLMGAVSDTFTATGSHQFTPFWTGTVNGGFALNRSLPQAGTTIVHFDDWFLGANIGRQFGRHMQASFSYGLTKPTIPVTCPATICGVSGYQHSFGLTVNWHLRPVG
ncbi:MAG TPA: hypothetical protein VGT24_03780 [Candidatus Acidoferrales bacterium]|nr:hypothetical protein [Candidatus Acidoferrales bacterium]